MGLLGNSIAIILTGITHQYWMVMLLSVIAGLFGSLFIQRPMRRCSAHYPKSPGMAIGFWAWVPGLVFTWPAASPAGAESAGAVVSAIAAWQRPLVELGAMGVVTALLYFFFAREAQRRSESAAQGGRTWLGPSPQDVSDFRHARLPRFGGGVRGFAHRHLFAAGASHGCQGNGSLCWAHDARQHRRKSAAGLSEPRGRRLPMLVLLLITSGLSLMVIPKISLTYTLGALAVFRSTASRLLRSR